MEDQSSTFENEPIIENRELNIWEALIPVFALIGMLAFNVYVFGDDALSGSNQFILLLGGAVAAIVGLFNKVKFDRMIDEVANNIQSTAGAILILLMVGRISRNLDDEWDYSNHDLLRTSDLESYHFLTCLCNYLFYNICSNRKQLDNLCNCGNCSHRYCKCLGHFSRNDRRSYLIRSLFWR